MINKITQSLQKIFEKQRIVFWYDTQRELRETYKSLEFSDIAKVELKNNEFRVKYRIIREEPDQKFLVYYEGVPPADLDNWLLDVQLASGEFRTDQSSIWLSELELGIEFKDIVKEHTYFFNSVKRREHLKKLLNPDDTQTIVKTKMVAVCTASDARIDEILETLLGELAIEKNDKLKLLEKCGLESFLWDRVKVCYGYQSETPSIQDFTIQLFKSCYEKSCFDMNGEKSSLLNADALIFIKRWKNSTLHQNDFEVLSDQCADILSIEKELQHRDISALEEIDCFELVDRKILSELVKSVVNQTIPANVRENLIRQRKLSHWYNRYCDLYEAIDYGARFIKAVEEADLNIESINSGIANYTNSWFLIDKLYRKYIFHTRKSGQVSMLNLLSDKVEKIYSNNYLLVVNNNWQKIIDKCSKWGDVTVTLSSFPVTTVSAASTIVVGLQRSFFKKKVLPFIRDNKKVFVIISDALRFEIGEELLSMIRQEDRFDAELEPMLSMLPSFTQLGMASLLPNNEIKFVDTDASTVLVDGQSSKGTENRTKILNNAVKGQAKAMRADELMAMNRDECRELFREHELVYIYHNKIDSTGDNKESEGGVFDAVDETLEELIKIIKKLAGANATNLIVTADHGFIYQNRAIEESDFLGNSVGYSDTQSTNSINVDSAKEGVPKILSYHRRFLLGKNLTENNSLKLFTSQQAGLEGDMDIQIPKSINRIRLKGSGSRFVHGGASLQEVIIPVVKIHKKRQSDTSQVEVDILGSSTSVITTGQFSAAFYQAQPVTEKVQPRILRAGIYSKDGVLLSDSHSLSFDFKSDNPRGREIKVRFILTRKADESNEQEVFLKLEELVSGTSYYKEYKSAKYVIRRSFTSDFDF